MCESVVKGGSFPVPVKSFINNGGCSRLSLPVKRFITVRWQFLKHFKACFQRRCLLLRGRSTLAHKSFFRVLCVSTAPPLEQSEVSVPAWRCLVAPVFRL